MFFFFSFFFLFLVCILLSCEFSGNVLTYHDVIFLTPMSFLRCHSIPLCKCTSWFKTILMILQLCIYCIHHFITFQKPVRIFFFLRLHPLIAGDSSQDEAEDDAKQITVRVSNQRNIKSEKYVKNAICLDRY